MLILMKQTLTLANKNIIVFYFENERGFTSLVFFVVSVRVSRETIKSNTTLSMKEILFNVARDDQNRFSAFLDDPLGGGICLT